MARGGVREGAGRKPGTRNVKTVEQVAAVEAAGLTPLDYLLSVMRTDADTARRIDAAKAAAPYVHARLSQVEAVVDGNVEVVGRVVWGGLSD